VLARRARAILDHMDTVEAELRGLREEPAGPVRLGAFQSAIHTLAVPAIARYPQLDVELLELEPHESIPALRGGDVDVIITTTDFGELPRGPDLDIAPLATDPIVLVSSPDRHVPRGPAVLLSRVRLRTPRGEPVQQLSADAAARRGRSGHRAAAGVGRRSALSRGHKGTRGARHAHDRRRRTSRFAATGRGEPGAHGVAGKATVDGRQQLMARTQTFSAFAPGSAL
jgi:DNA-binding transcriptional LysR family regulator